MADPPEATSPGDSRGSAHDGEPGLGKDVATDQAGSPEKRRLESKSPAAARDQGLAALEKGPGSGHFERKQRAQLGRVVAREEGGFVDTESASLLFREIDPSALGVLGDILPVVQELKPGADRIAGFEGQGIPGHRGVEQLYHQSTDGVGGVAAVSEKFLEICVAYLLGVASEGAKEGLKTADVEIVTSNFSGAGPQGPVGSTVPVYSTEKSTFPFPDGPGALFRRGPGLFFVGDVIRDTDHGIDRGERPSRRARQ